MRKAPSVVAWNRWLQSSAGQACAEGKADGKYLENRLWSAFMAGWNGAESALPESITAPAPAASKPEAGKGEK